MKELKKQDLLTGDIVVERDGTLGIVLAEKEAIIYSGSSGMDFFDNFTEDLLLDDDYRGSDIMTVYRDRFGGPISFFDYEDYDPIFEREDDVVWNEDMRWKEPQEKTDTLAATQPKREEYYGVIQALYGNRTGIGFTEENVDGLIMGYLNSRFYDREKFDRSVIYLLDEEGLVLIYNKYQEEERLQDKERAFRESGYVLKPLAVVPELNLELYSRCLACRMDADGKLESLREEDYETVMKYLAE